MTLSLVFIAILFGFSLYNLVTAIRLEVPRKQTVQPLAKLRKRVSLLIPVRNEAQNLPALVRCLGQIDYSPLEILILDDESTDDSYRILQSSGYVALRGRPTPSGWVGKNWACHQLTEAAKGDLLLFCDADVTITPRAVADTVNRMEEYHTKALTALPRQLMQSWSEKAVIPLVMHQSVVGTLPLNLLHRLSSPSLLVCNGQWLCIDRAAYFSVGGHQRVKDSFVEDMALGRELKRAGYPLLTVVAARSLEVRMYKDWPALKEGFTKNLYPLMGGNLPLFSLCLLLFVYANGVSLLSLTGFLLLLLNRLIVARLFRTSAGSVLFHPIGLVTVLYLSICSLAKTKWGAISWKGRETVHRVTK